MAFNTRFKFYGDELVEIMRVSRCIFCSDKFDKNSSDNSVEKSIEKERVRLWNSELDSDVEMYQNIVNSIERSKVENLQRSQRRAKNAVFDLVGCNPDLNLFVTLTLDQSKISRTDYKVVIKKLNTWLDNRVRRLGLKYVLTAEYHKKGGIHFHALMNSVFRLVDSGHVDKNGHIIYNLPDWDYGFTTAIQTYGDRSSVCGYITKYITKSDDKVGGRWYYSGGKLERPVYAYDNTTFDGSAADDGSCGQFVAPSDSEFGNYEFDVENTKTHFQVWKKRRF